MATKTKVKTKTKAKLKTKSKVKPVVQVTEPTYERLTKAEYARALQHPKWQKKRLKIFERDDWQCKKCGNTESTLAVHHLRYTCKFPWQEDNVNLVTLCTSCHSKAHKVTKR